MVVGKKAGTCSITGMVNNQKTSCAITVTGSTLPQGWSYDELNAPPIPGAVLVSGTRFTLTGCGHAMTSFWERVRDQGVFASKPVTGETELTAQLTNLAPDVGGRSYQGDNRPPTASGLMIRESLSEAAGRYFLVQVEASGNVVCRWRSSKVGDQDDKEIKQLGKMPLPTHLKLRKKADEIQVFTSTDAKDWGEPRLTYSATFGGESRIGLFVCSGNPVASSTATFENVVISSW